jgi:hypothetical protein
MLPLLTHPWALWGLLAVPALAAVYLFRNRFRRHPVSSLMLWAETRESRAGGTRLDRLQMPLLLLLEVLAVVLLVLTAADPQVRTAQGARPLVVVLDDSFSMRAGGDDSARDRAAKAIGEELRRSPPYSIRLVLAGERPQVLGEPVHTAGEAVALLSGWTCKAPAARLDEAITLATELGGELALLLVVTDHEPGRGTVPDRGRVRWWAFGSPRPNFAFVQAVRSSRGGPDRCLLEVANLAPEPRATTLVVEAGTPPQAVRRSPLALGAGETRRVVLQLDDGTPALRARLDDDDLAIDNQVTLLPAVERPARVEVRVREEALRGPVEKALRSVRGAVLTDVRPEIVFTDEEGEEPGRDVWVVRLLAEKDAAAYAGPFVLDRAHPLTEGLSLQGVVWGAGKAERLPGLPVIMAGNVPLVTDVESVGLHREVRLRLRPDLSTLPDSPNWPILVYNLVQWHGSLAPGLSRPNVRLGEETVLTLAADRESVQLVGPGGGARALPVQGRRVVARAEDVGVYELRAGEGKFPFAVNALSREESDLTACATGRWGDWLDETSLRLEYQSVAWVLLVLLLAVLTVHMFLAARGAGRAGL